MQGLVLRWDWWWRWGPRSRRRLSAIELQLICHDLICVATAIVCHLLFGLFSGHKLLHICGYFRAAQCSVRNLIWKISVQPAVRLTLIPCCFQYILIAATRNILHINLLLLLPLYTCYKSEIYYQCFHCLIFLYCNYFIVTQHNTCNCLNSIN